MTSDEERTARTGTGGPARRTFVVRVAGDMDLEHEARLRALLLDGVARAPRGADVVVDLRNSSFCDSTGLTLLLAAREAVRGTGSSLVLAAPSHQMVRLLELSDCVGLFRLGPAPPRSAEEPGRPVPARPEPVPTGIRRAENPTR
ncbi:STAS domain-containing protein [Streptomyces griseus]|uniref:STAS domain-containing protein n=1 Tax=Streptomyces griseus TaxID=1911 RepID=UPI00068A376B|nr:STAS domain-containing protein [Streptomyces griseus]